jgi:predicted GIY-YIG superfamily endonuclease
MATTQTTKRKRRSDTNHIVYCLTAPNGERYVGVTVKDPDKTVRASLARRYRKHVNRCRTENLDWALYNAMRAYGPEAFRVEPVEVVRGKTAAHARERVLTRELGATLNSH